MFRVRYGNDWRRAGDWGRVREHRRTSWTLIPHYRVMCGGGEFSWEGGNLVGEDRMADF